MIDSIGGAFQNLMILLACPIDYECPLVQGTDSGFTGALFILFGLLAGGVYLSSTGLLAVMDIQLRRPIRMSVYAAMAFIWLWLCFGYAVPQAIGTTNYIVWSVQVALFAAFLMIGVLAMLGYLIFLVHSVRTPGMMMPVKRWGRLIMMGALVGLIYGWQYVYEANPSIQNGPFQGGPNWYMQLLTVWSLEWPTTSLWWFVTFLATDTGLIFFSIVAATVVVFPVGRRIGVGTVAAGVAGHLTGSIIAIVVSLVLGLLIFATGVLALMVAMFYFLYITLFALLVGGIISWAVKS